MAGLDPAMVIYVEKSDEPTSPHRTPLASA